MELRGVARDPEPRGDGLVAEPFGQHAEHLDLAGGQRLRGISRHPRRPRLAARSRAERFGMQHHQPRHHRVDGGQDLSRGGIARQHRARQTALHRLVRPRAPGRVGQHHQRGRDRVGQRGRHRVQAVAVEIEQHHGRPQRFHQTRERRAGRAGHQAQPAAGGHHRLEPGLHGGARRGDQHPGHHVSPAAAPARSAAPPGSAPPPRARPRSWY